MSIVPYRCQMVDGSCFQKIHLLVACMHTISSQHLTGRVFISMLESANVGIVTENCGGKNQILSVFVSFVISFLVSFFTTLELVIGLGKNHY